MVLLCPGCALAARMAVLRRAIAWQPTVYIRPPAINAVACANIRVRAIQARIGHDRSTVALDPEPSAHAPDLPIAAMHPSRTAL